MALIKLLDFTSAGQHYQVYYDDVVRVVSTTADPGPAADSVDLADAGVVAGQVLYWHCVDGFLYRVRARTAYPFAWVKSEIFTLACRFTACDLVIDAVATVGESEQGAGDGEATVSATTSADYLQYSLDGFAWQLDNHFFGLLPGRYNLYVKDNQGCTATSSFTIAAGVAVVEEPYPWQQRVCKFFRLLVPDGLGGYTTVPIEEPGQWDKVNFIGKRDREWHGYRGMWSDGIVELEFDCAAGAEELRAAYETYGSDAEVLFQYGYTRDAVDVVLFPGKINFNVYKDYDYKIVVSVEREDFSAALTARLDTKVSMMEAVGYGGAPLVAPLPADIALHAKEIVRKFSVTSSQEQAYNGGTTVSTSFLYLQPDTSTPQLNEIETVYGYPLGYSTEVPYQVDKYNLDAKFAGTYDVHIGYNMAFWVKPLFMTLDYTITHYWRLNDQETQVGSTTTGHAGYNQAITAPFVVNYDLPGLQLQAGDKLYFYTRVVFNGSKTIATAAIQYSTNISITSLENTGESECKGWLIHDVVNHAVRVITNGVSRLKSSLLALAGPQQAIDGQAALNLLTNGRQIRRFDVVTSPLQVSLKDLLTSIRAHWCVGWGAETIGRTDVVRIERADYFYQDHQICVIEEPDMKSYYYECAKDMLYNELEFGYEKFQDSGYNTLDEFNTRHEHVTPIETNKLKLTAKSKFIASGYSIETSRREQYEDTPNDSVENDDETFIVAVKKGNGVYVTERNESFDVVNNLISPQTAYNLRHSPYRMLLNWSVWLRNVLHYKQLTEVVRNTFVAQNGALETQFTATEPRPLGDLNRLKWQEKQDVTLQDLAVERRIFRPDYIYFRARLTPDVVGLIHQAMRGQASKEKNYGYIVVRNPKGTYDAGFLLEIEYNFYTEVAQFKLLQRFEGVDPVQECCPYLVVNGCYVKINGLKTVV